MEQPNGPVYMETFGHDNAAKPADTYGNAGSVRPLDGLNFEPDYVDCPYCEMRVRTKTVKVENENTPLFQWLCCMVGFPICCITYFIPKKAQWKFHTQHRCPKCDTLLQTVRCNHVQGNSAFVPSKWATTYQGGNGSRKA